MSICSQRISTSVFRMHFISYPYQHANMLTSLRGYTCIYLLIFDVLLRISWKHIYCLIALYLILAHIQLLMYKQSATICHSPNSCQCSFLTKSVFLTVVCCSQRQWRAVLTWSGNANQPNSFSACQCHALCMHKVGLWAESNSSSKHSSMHHECKSRIWLEYIWTFSYHSDITLSCIMTKMFFL